VRLDSGTASPITGRVAEVSRIDATGHGFLVKIDLPPSGNLRSGMFGRALFTGASHPMLSAPLAAVVRRGQLSFAFVVGSDGMARLRPLITGRAFGDRIEVLAGLADGDELVMSPQPSIADGTRVNAGARR